MTDTPAAPNPPPAPTSAAARPSDIAPVVKETPLGYVRTHVLEFVNGILHQVHEAPHSGQEPAKVLVPVPGSSTAPGLLADVEQLVEQRVQILEKAFAEKFAWIEGKLNPPTPPSS